MTENKYMVVYFIPWQGHDYETFDNLAEAAKFAKECADHDDEYTRVRLLEIAREIPLEKP